jgi:choline transport protein
VPPVLNLQSLTGAIAAGKKAVLKREWNFLAVLAFSAVTLATWEATSALFASAYFNGGPASVVYGFIVSVAGTACIATSMAEMASMFVCNAYITLA